MAILSDIRKNINLPLFLPAGAASLGIFFFLYSIRSLGSKEPEVIPSPRETLLPRLSKEEIKNLPYPPDALPGARDVDSPYGSIRVYEWGPLNGEKILFIHGISTPSIALGGLAHKLVEKNCRVMLFDLFGRGYSSAPSPYTHPYSSALYTTQIHLVLQSSPLSWSTSPFTLIGYSLGGALAADFTSYFPRLISHLFLIAPGGLIRTSHVTWKSRLLYSTSGLLPEWLIEKMVARRLWTGPEGARSIEPEPDVAVEKEKERTGGLQSRAVYLSGNIGLIPERPNSTAGYVVDGQILCHKGFVPAFISSIRYAPIHEQHHRWMIIGERMREGFFPLKKVNLILGEIDPIIIADEITEDARELLGQEFMDVRPVKGAGHEVPIQRVDEVAGIIAEGLGRTW
ncbi:alpha/beta-hydrolase [Zopfia rhizophila CBS 207.26]|uniref:Alpha/beta-hydrolase n=1 Tax=Zopfia rhizophila CBS 207.26 TaxID=1314779 RepID=A0A6A6EKN8_9PEZI|nr:alpha/beta-hydrolase [Zopfia rhizophila CBS 207.26]